MINARHPSGSVLSAQEEALMANLSAALDVHDDDLLRHANTVESDWDGGTGALAERVRASLGQPAYRHALLEWLSAYVDNHPTIQYDDLAAYCTADEPVAAQLQAFTDLDRLIVVWLKNALLPELVMAARNGDDEPLAAAFRGDGDDWFDRNVIAVLGQHVGVVGAAGAGLRDWGCDELFEQATRAGRELGRKFGGELGHEFADDSDTLADALEDEDRQDLEDHFLRYLQDMVRRMEEWQPLSMSRLRKSLDKIFIAHGWANEQIPNAKAFRKSLHVVVKEMLKTSGLAESLSADAQRAERARLVSKYEKATGLDLFMRENRNGFYAWNWETDYPSELGSLAESREVKTIDTTMGSVRLGIEKEFAETVSSHRIDATLLNDNGDWRAICNFHIIEGPFRGANANACFVSAMDELDDESTMLAYDLSTTYGAKAIFRHGDLLCISHVEVRTADRGKGLGAKFLSECLRAVGEQFPKVTSIAARIAPVQYKPLPVAKLPATLVRQQGKDQQRLERYFESIKDTLTTALSVSERPATLFVAEASPEHDFGDVIHAVGSTFVQAAMR